MIRMLRWGTLAIALVATAACGTKGMSPTSGSTSTVAPLSQADANLVSKAVSLATPTTCPSLGGSMPPVVSDGTAFPVGVPGLSLVCQYNGQKVGSPIFVIGWAPGDATSVSNAVFQTQTGKSQAVGSAPDGTAGGIATIQSAGFAGGQDYLTSGSTNGPNECTLFATYGSGTAVILSQAAGACAAERDFYLHVVAAASGANDPNSGAAGSSTALPIDAGAVIKTSVFHMTDGNGYKANVTVVWHKEIKVDGATVAQYPGCGMDASSPAPGATYYLITADVHADFPTVNGFKWPAGHYGLNFTQTTDSQQGICGDTQSSSGVWNGPSFAPDSSPDAHVMWVEIVQSTPNDPTPPAPTHAAHAVQLVVDDKALMTAGLNDNGHCTGPGVDHLDPVFTSPTGSACSSSY